MADKKTTAASKLEARFQEYVRALVYYCRKACIMDEYALRITFADKDCDRDDDSCGFGIIVLSIEIDDVYLQALITIYPEMFRLFEAGDFNSCGKYMLHELCHIFIKPVSNLWDEDDNQKEHDAHMKVIERQTQRISNALYQALPNNWDYPDNLLKTSKKINERRASNETGKRDVEAPVADA